MLSQTAYWMEIAGTAVDALLLIRVLSLKLQRVYVFITLACVLELFFDALDLWFRSDTVVGPRIFIYSRSHSSQDRFRRPLERRRPRRPQTRSQTRSSPRRSSGRMG